MEYDPSDDEWKDPSCCKHPAPCTCPDCEHNEYLVWWNNIGRFEYGLALE